MRSWVFGLALLVWGCGGGNEMRTPDAFTSVPDAAPPECTASATCPTAEPLCKDESCVVCAGSTDDGECAARSPATPRRGPAGQCVECLANTECGSGLCRNHGCVPPGM
jgi:hypothetical protein